jgi:serine protease
VAIVFNQKSIVRGSSIRLISAAVALALSCGAVAQSRASETDQAAIDAKINFAPLADENAYDQVIVYFAENADANRSDGTALAENIALAGANSDLKLDFVRTISTGGHLVKIARTDSGKETVKSEAAAVDDLATERAMRAIAALPDVTSVEPDALLQPFFTPNDTDYAGKQWHYFEATGGLNLPLAWDKATGAGVVVAVIDTGITNHSDLNANIVAGYDFISSATAAADGDGRDANPADAGDATVANQCRANTPARNSSFHGTHVTGTIAAVSNNAKGVAGVAFGAKVSPLRALGKCGGSLSDIADAITWASGGTVSGVPANANVAKVINMSLGGPGACGTTSQTAITNATNRGTVVVVAAGNDGADASGFNPASCANVINVAASNRAGGRAYYSNFGASVDVAAPGGELFQNSSTNGVWSTLNAGTTAPGAESYAFYQGTSMASPHVAGVAALILSKGAQTPAQVEALLKANTRAFPASCVGCGTGIVDANKVLTALGGGGGGGAFFQNTNDFTISDNTTVDSPITVSGVVGNAPSTLSVAVNIVHTYQGDLKVDLVAPDGSLYNIHNRTGAGTDNIIKTVTINASSEVANGIWKLRVNDNAGGDVGFINSWSMQF